MPVGQQEIFEDERCLNALGTQALDAAQPRRVLVNCGMEQTEDVFEFSVRADDMIIGNSRTTGQMWRQVRYGDSPLPEKLPEFAPQMIIANHGNGG